MDLLTGKGLDQSGSIALSTSNQNDASTGDIIVKGSRVLIQSRGKHPRTGEEVLKISTGTSTGESSTGVLAKAGDGTNFGGALRVSAGESSQYVGGSLLARTANQKFPGSSGSISIASSSSTSGRSGRISFANLKSAGSFSSKDTFFQAGQASTVGGNLHLAAGSTVSSMEAGKIIASAGSSETGSAGSVSVYSGAGAVSSGSVAIRSGRSESGQLGFD